MAGCSIDGCGEKAQGQEGWCGMHYMRWLRHGDTGPPGRLRRRSGTGSIMPRGYILEGRNGKYAHQHRHIWEEHHGSIPEGYHVHHINGVRDDNRIENLEMLSPVEHSKKHWVVPYQGDDCTMEGCTRKYRCRGLCAKHYSKWQRDRGCSVRGCLNKYFAREVCKTHWQRRLNLDGLTDVV